MWMKYWGFDATVFILRMNDVFSLSSFPVIHEVGNVVIFVLLRSEGKLISAKKFASSGNWTC